jgi:hypothetical protein
MKFSNRDDPKSVFLLIAGLFALGSAFTGMRCLTFINHAKVAQGTVTRLSAGGSHPQIRFLDSNGKTIEYPQGGFIFGFHPGDPVEVLYSDDPWYGPCIHSFGALWFFPILLAILSAMMFVPGLQGTRRK